MKKLNVDRMRKYSSKETPDRMEWSFHIQDTNETIDRAIDKWVKKIQRKYAGRQDYRIDVKQFADPTKPRVTFVCEVKF